MNTLIALMLAAAFAPSQPRGPSRLTSESPSPLACRRVGELEVTVTRLARVDRFRAPPADLQPLWAAAPCEWEDPCIAVTIETRSPNADATVAVGDLRLLDSRGDVFRPLTGSYPDRLVANARYTFIFPNTYWIHAIGVYLGEVWFSTPVHPPLGDFGVRGFVPYE